MYLSAYKTVFSILVSICTLTSLPALANQPRTFSSEAEKLFEHGLDFYRQGHYRQAQDYFQRLLGLPFNQRSSAGQLMLGKTLFRMGDYAAAVEMANGLEQRFAASRYIPETLLLAGDGYYMLKRYYEAADRYGRLVMVTAPLRVQVQAAERLAAVVENALLSADGLERLRVDVGDELLREALLFGKARWFQRLGWEELAGAAIREYRENIAGGIFSELAEDAVERRYSHDLVIYGDAPAYPFYPTRSQGAQELGKPRLGVLLPLSEDGFQRRVGEDLYAGIQLANEQFGEPFELILADIGVEYDDLQLVESESRRLLRVAEQTKRLIQQEKVLAIIGPVFSGDCVVAAVVAQAAGVPLIAPLAQQSGLDLLGENIFQLQPIPEVQARALGEYATLVLGLQNLAVIAPLTDYGWSFEREFTRAAYMNGGDIVYVDWYFPKVTKDFRRIFEDIRRVGFKLMPPPVDDDSPAKFDIDSSLSVSDQLALWERQTAPPDSSTMFVDTIDGIVIVVESFEDAKTIAPQLRFHRLQSQILGNDIWYEPDEIRQMRPRERGYLGGGIMVGRSPEATASSLDFTEAFRRRFVRDVGYAAYGYDAARMVMSGWNNGWRTPGSLRIWLGELRDFEGASGRISFAHGRRINTELVLLKIDSRGWIRPLGQEDLPDLLPTEYWQLPPEEDLPRAELTPDELENYE